MVLGVKQKNQWANIASCGCTQYDATIHQVLLSHQSSRWCSSFTFEYRTTSPLFPQAHVLHTSSHCALAGDYWCFSHTQTFIRSHLVCGPLNLHRHNEICIAYWLQKHNVDMVKNIGGVRNCY